VIRRLGVCSRRREDSRQEWFDRKKKRSGLFSTVEWGGVETAGERQEKGGGGWLFTATTLVGGDAAGGERGLSI